MDQQLATHLVESLKVLNEQTALEWYMKDNNSDVYFELESKPGYTVRGDDDYPEGASGKLYCQHQGSERGYVYSFSATFVTDDDDGDTVTFKVKEAESAEGCLDQLSTKIDELDGKLWQIVCRTLG